MVHSSFKSLGKVDGGVMTFIDALKEGKNLDAQSYVMDSKTVWNTVLNKMQEEPYYFVSRTMK